MRSIRPATPLALAVLLIAGPALADAAKPAPPTNAAPPRKVVSVAAPGTDGKQSVAFARALPDGTPAEIAAADSTYPLGSFAEALERAYWTNPNLLAERSKTKATDYRLPQARSQFGPRIDYNASYGFTRDNYELAAGGYRAFSGWTKFAQAVLTQPLFTFGRVSAAEHEAASQIAFQRAVLRYTESQTLLKSIDAYASVLRDRTGVAIAADNLALLEKELADTSTRLAGHEVTTTDVQQVETRVEQGRAQLYAAQRAAASSDAAFLSHFGAPAGTLDQPSPLAMPFASLEEAYAWAELHSPVIAAANEREKISRAQRDGARAALMPRVDLKGNAQVGTVAPYTSGLMQTELRGQVVVSGPLFASGLYRAQLAEASATNDADWHLIDNALRENRAEVADAWNEWLAQSASIDRLKASVAAAQAAYDGALTQERAGIRTTLDVLDLARELLVARSGYNAATANAYVAQARLLAAVGALEHGYLFPDAPRFDPDVHYDRVKHMGDMPLVTPLVRTIDSIVAGHGGNRPVRDPAGPVAVSGVDIPAPVAAAAGK